MAWNKGCSPIYHGGMLGLIRVKPHSRTTCKRKVPSHDNLHSLASPFLTAIKKAVTSLLWEHKLERKLSLCTTE